ncbi:glutaredoxin family protein [Candidatus Omnitrophota bacterium]
MPTLVLYYSPFCPYCRKVLAFMSEKSIELELKDIGASQENKDTLQSVGGKVQVPCLLIDGKPMYESDVIIAWLTENF